MNRRTPLNPIEALIEEQRAKIAELEAQIATMKEEAAADAAIMRVINRAVRREVEMAVTKDRK